MNYNQKKKKSIGFIVAVVLVSIAVILTSTVLVLKVTGKKGKQQAIKEPNENIIEDNLDYIDEEEEFEEEKETLEEEPILEEEVKEPVVEKLALQYLPKSGMILKYMNYYTDGTEGVEEWLIGQMDPEILVSKAIMLPEEREPLNIYHYVEGKDGIYVVQNDNPEDSSIWLPNNPKVGDTWKNLYSEHKIMEIGVSIEAGGKTFENCIMRKNTTDIAEFVNISYIAPGYGEVYSVYGGGAIEFELIEEKKDDFELAEDVMRGKMKYLDAILRYREK